MTVPDGAQLSEDGKYWWDGSDWQPVPEDGGGSTEVGQLSDDGKWKWDGDQWQPVDDETGDGAGAEDAGGDLHGALTDKGFDLPAESADADYIKQIYDHVSNWYDGLGDDDKAIFDALSAQGGDQILADPEVGVVNEGDPLIAAFAGTSNTLGESLQATGEALDQVQS
jgi:hypothetical protein